MKIIPADDMPKGADMNGMTLGAHMIVTEHKDGTVVAEWHGFDTLRDAQLALALIEDREESRLGQLLDVYA